MGRAGATQPPARCLTLTPPRRAPPRPPAPAAPSAGARARAPRDVGPGGRGRGAGRLLSAPRVAGGAQTSAGRAAPAHLLRPLRASARRRAGRPLPASSARRAPPAEPPAAPRGPAFSALPSGADAAGDARAEPLGAAVAEPVPRRSPRGLPHLLLRRRGRVRRWRGRPPAARLAHGSPPRRQSAEDRVLAFCCCFYSAFFFPLIFFFFFF